MPLLLIAAVAMGQTASVADISLEPGDEAMLEVNYTLPSSGTYVGFMFVVELPDGLSLSEDPDDPGYPWYDDEVAAISKMNITTTEAGGFAATPKKATSTINGTSGVLMRMKVKASATLAPGTYTGKLKEVSFNVRDDNYNVSKTKINDVTFSITVQGGEQPTSDLWIKPADINLEPGNEALLDINYSLPTSGNYVGFMFIVELPNGLSLSEDPDDPGYPWYDDEVTAISKMNITTTEAGGFAATPKKTTSTINGTSGVLMRIKVKASATLAPGTYTGKLKEVSFNLRDDSYNVSKTKVDDATFTITVKSTDVPVSQTLTVEKGWNWLSCYTQEPVDINKLADNCNRILSQTQELIRDPQLGIVGSLTALEPGKGYKVDATANFSSSFSGLLLNASIQVERGWNWIAYPITESKSLNSVLPTAETGDYITGQTGFAEYGENGWEGTLTTLTPGAGYLYKSVTAKALNFNANAAARGAKQLTVDSEIGAPDAEMVALSHRYPSTMNITARIYAGGREVTEEDYRILAMAGDELRGKSMQTDGRHYITVYGEQAVRVHFIIEHQTTGETWTATETMMFTDDVVGSHNEPFAFTIPVTTGIWEIESTKAKTEKDGIFDLQGRRIGSAGINAQSSIPNAQLKKGIYIVHGKKCYVK